MTRYLFAFFPVILCLWNFILLFLLLQKIFLFAFLAGLKVLFYSSSTGRGGQPDRQDIFSSIYVSINFMATYASLGLDAAYIEDIDYTVDRTINKKTVKILSTCAFIEGQGDRYLVPKSTRAFKMCNVT